MKLRGSIRTQLFALVLAVALPFIGLLAYTIYADAQNRAQQARASTLSLAQLAAANTLQFLADTESLLATLAQRPAISAMNPAQCDPLLNTIPEPYPYFANIAVIDLTGRVICTSLPYPDGALTSATQEVWFQSVKQSGAFVAGEPSLDPATGKWVSVGAYPIRNDEGELVGVLGLTIDLVRYQLILDDISLPPGATLTIVDGEGTVVARSLESEKWVGQNVRGTEIVDIVLAQDEGQAQARGFDGVDRIWGFTTVPDANWHVYVGVPTEAVFAPVRAALIPTGLLVLMSMILVVVLAGSFGRRIVDPIVWLQSATQRIDQGNLNTPVSVSGPEEIRQLARSFDEMRQRLATSQADLESRVAARVRELTTLYAVSRAISSLAELSEVCGVIAREVSTTLGYGAAAILLLDREREELFEVAYYGHGLQRPNSRLKLGEGLCSRAVLTGQVCITPDVTLEPAYVPGLPGCRSEADIPIKLREEVIGVLVAEDARVNAYTGEDVSLLTAVADQAAVAIDNARLYEHSRAQRLEEQAALLKLTQALLGETEVQRILDRTVRGAAEALRVELATAALLDVEGNIWPEATVGWSLEALRQPPGIPLTAPTPLGEAIRTRAPVAIPDFARETRLQVHPALAQSGIAAALVAPMFVVGEAIGGLAVHSRVAREWSADEARLLSLIANAAAQAFGRARLETTLRKLSSAIEQTADPVFITGVDGRIEYVNSAFTAVTGFSAEEAIGQTPRLLKSGAHPTAFYQQLWESILSGNTWHGILINQKKDGEVYYAEYSISPILSPQGRIANFVAVQKDITGRRRAEEEGRLLQIISLAAGGAENLRGALYLALQTVCEETNWVAGEAWIQRADGAVLECSPVWYSRVPGLENFHAASMEITCAPGAGLPGRVWASKKPAWVRDVTLDPEFVRASLAREVGFKAAMGIPIISRGEVVAVAIFFVFEPRKEDERFLGVVSAVAAQLGTVIERRLAEAALQESEARYRAIVQDQTELICRTLSDGSLTFVNDAYCRYFNQTAEALLGHKSQPPIHAEDVEVVTRKRAALSIQAPTVTYWHRVSLPDGQIRWQQWTDRALFSEQGEVIEIQSVGQDITARKRAEETLKQRNEELLALNAIATTISHAPDVNRLVNDVLDELPKLLAMDGGCVYLHDEKHATRSLLLAAQRGTLPDITERLRTIHLGETPAAEAGAAEEPAALIAHVLKMFEVSGWEVGPGCAGAPIQSKDKMLGVLCLFRRGPNELSRHERQTLATIGHQIGVAIENVRLAEQTVEIEILRELDRLRSELIANVSHELRTPLGLIMLFCTTLLQQEVDLDRETQREFLNDIKEEADRLEKIVNNLLDLSRMQNGRLYLDRQPTDIAQLVRATLASVRPQLTAHRLVYDFPPQPLVTVADSKRVEQVLRNLVSNAVKYSPVGGEITIRGSSTENEIMIQVSDQGIGIPPQDLTRVFERFYRAANEATQQVDGVGLGLAVCRGIVEAHGGRIWVESTPGIGSTFNFTLPAGPQAEAEAE